MATVPEWCAIKIFKGGGKGWWMALEGGDSERGLKWGGGCGSH